jgi:putative transposase
MVIERALAEQAIVPDTLTLGTDTGSAYTARQTKAALSGLSVADRRGGYRDPESQAFIESWFSKPKERLIWRTEFETLEQAREALHAYINSYHDRPHSRLSYRTPAEVRKTWDDAKDALHKTAA